MKKEREKEGKGKNGMKEEENKETGKRIKDQNRKERNERIKGRKTGKKRVK